MASSSYASRSTTAAATRHAEPQPPPQHDDRYRYRGDVYDEEDEDQDYDRVPPPSPPIRPSSTASTSSKRAGTLGTLPPLMRRSSSSGGASATASARPSGAASVGGAPLGPRSSFGGASSASIRRRTSASGGGAGGCRPSPSSISGLNGARIPIQPPKHPDMFDTEEQWRTHLDTTEKTQAWHHLPLFLVVLPPLGAVVHGRAENWSDGIVITIVCFYLYQLIKVPWDIYYASHARVVLDAALPKPGQEGYDPQQAQRKDFSVRQLKRTELLSLLATMLVPAAGSGLLYYARGLLSDPDRYINRFLISMFAIATSVKPFLHFAKLVQHNSLYHQEQVWYPSTEVHFLRRRIEALEKDLSQLTRAFATKDDVRNLRDGVDVPLSQLSKAVRRFDRKEEYLRLSSEERFSLLEQRLEEATRERHAQQTLIEQLRFEAHNANLIQQVVQALRFTLFGAHHHRARVEQRQLKWFEKGPFFWVFLPVNGPRLAIEYISNTNDFVPPASWQDHKAVGGIGVSPMSSDPSKFTAL
ncbi:BZ3500_MvSof-1268-A1-R1_Chr6-2g08429 [Microbotryum saponariae]|uniref:BZ3500_MvSof-1268-A1-R1_Chr6-2g08429 protein n=1 Tax=Microbotryum saponariae TaxID=289078 RepID=A0A2X0NNC1_9BASI|nr:BZ3500_MvSof-1268-A1-R1_Chr6-2g08429 [Microbotryum saponariae]SDA07706.1 BZ3501_MvSof-1269-A2-R1_Chr6-1g08143 [Microbotryum saponariae]